MFEFMEFVDVRNLRETRMAVKIEFNAGTSDAFQEWVPKSVIEENPGDIIEEDGIGFVAIAEWWCLQEGLAVE